jgi:hypothetical protein
VGSDALLFSSASDSSVTISAKELILAGSIYAGATFNETGTNAWTGTSASINIETKENIIIGGKGPG